MMSSLVMLPRKTGDTVRLAREAYLTGALACLAGKTYSYANNVYLSTPYASDWCKGFSDADVADDDNPSITARWMAGDRYSFDGCNWHSRDSIFDFMSDVAEAMRQGDSKYIDINTVTWSFEVRADAGLLDLTRI